MEEFKSVDALDHLILSLRFESTFSKLLTWYVEISASSQFREVSGVASVYSEPPEIVAISW